MAKFEHVCMCVPCMCPLNKPSCTLWNQKYLPLPAGFERRRYRRQWSYCI